LAQYCYTVLLVSRQEGHPSRKKDWLLVVTFWLELYTSY